MSEEEIVNRFLNMIATKYNGDLADQFKNQYILKDKEIERLIAESTKWESKFYDEAKKVDKAIEYIDKIKEKVPVDLYLCFNYIEELLRGKDNEN